MFAAGYRESGFDSDPSLHFYPSISYDDLPGKKPVKKKAASVTAPEGSVLSNIINNDQCRRNQLVSLGISNLLASLRFLPRRQTFPQLNCRRRAL